MVRLRSDEIYRTAMQSADYAIPDSGLMVLVWKVLKREDVQRVSGLAYLQRLIARLGIQAGGSNVLRSAERQLRSANCWTGQRVTNSRLRPMPVMSRRSIR